MMKILSQLLRVVLLVCFCGVSGCMKLQAVDPSSPQAGGSSGSGGGSDGVRAASTWMGVNGDAEYPYVDITHNLAPFDTPASSKDAYGYPVAGASGTSSTDVGFNLPPGTYKVSYQGPSNAVSFSGIASLVGNWQTVGNEQRGSIQTSSTRGSFGHPLIVTINCPSNAAVSNLHIYYQGHDYGDTAYFNRKYLQMIQPFRAVRLMGMMGTNLGWDANNPAPPPHIAEWADRPKWGVFGNNSFGMPYEAIWALANESGKDLWVNIPEYASDDFVHQWADDMRTHLDMNRIKALRAAQGLPPQLRVIVEYSNETWNGGFYVQHHLLNDANADPARYGGAFTTSYGPDWMAGYGDLQKVGRVEGDRLAHFIQIFRGEFASVSASDVAIESVLSGWELGPAYTDMALQFIATHYSGQPKDYVTYIAPAGYVGPDDSQTGTLSSLFAGFDASVDAWFATMEQFRAIADQYDVKLTIYEGGQGMGGATNYELKHLAEFDRRMYDSYERMWAIWEKKFPGTLFMHFSLSGGEGSPDYTWWETPGKPWKTWGWWNAIPYQETDLSACGQNMQSFGDPTADQARSQIDQLHTMVSPPCPKYQSISQHTQH